MTTDIAVRDDGAEIMERVLVAGDLAKLTPGERNVYYTAVCRSLGLNPLTRPFEYIVLNGKLTLYARKDATDQIRSNVGISITRLERETTAEGTYDVTAYGRARDGREDGSIGSVPIAGLKGEALSNAKMKAETKAKRRLTLSLAGLGFTDETEISSIPSAEPVEVDAAGNIHRPTLAERVAVKVAVVPPPPEPAPEPDDFPSDDDLVGHGLELGVGSLMERSEFNRRAVEAKLSKGQVEDAANALGLPVPAERTPADYGRLADHLGL